MHTQHEKYSAIGDGIKEFSTESDGGEQNFVAILKRNFLQFVVNEYYWRHKEGEFIKQPLDDAALQQHIAGKPVSVSLIAPGSNQLRAAVLDFDDHPRVGAPPVGWKRVCEAAQRVMKLLRRQGRHVTPIRSGSGTGIHLWERFGEPHDARTVRESLGDTLAIAGFEEKGGGFEQVYEDGARLVIEIFPKSNSVELGGYGNGIALPFSRKSILLAKDLSPNEARNPAFAYSGLPEVNTRSIGASNGQASENPRLQDVKEALQYYKNDELDYYSWSNVGYPLKTEFGEKGWSLFRDWSATSAKNDPEETKRFWDTIAVRPEGAKRRMIGSIFYEAKKHGYVPPQRADAKRSKADALYAIIDEAELWHTPKGEPYATVVRDGHDEHYHVESRGFSDWLRLRFLQETGKGVSATALKDAEQMAVARAKFGDKEHNAHLRVAEFGGKLYLDLTDKAWRAVEIDGDGWRIVDRPPVRFRRGGGRALPEPEPGGNIGDLHRFLNVGDDEFKLIVGTLIATFRPGWPIPILFFSGEQGTAKSTALRICLRLTDPRSAEERSLPQKEDDLIVSAANNWVMSADNVSGIKPEMADALCRLVTGGGLTKRALYTNDEEFVIEVKRPMMMTGINVPSQRPDFLERLVAVRMSPITQRRTESEVMAEFEAARAKVLGALLDGVSMALRNLPEVHERMKNDHPRMGDFVEFVEAAAPAFGWHPGEFATAYKRMQQGLMIEAGESNPVVEAVRFYIDRYGKLEGTATSVMIQLERALEGTGKRRILEGCDWPKTPNWLSDRLRRGIPILREFGIEAIHGKNNSNHSYWRIARTATSLFEENGRDDDHF